MLKEFKEFIMKGSIVDLAVAVVIGAAFGAIINSLIGDIVTPLLLAPALKAAGVEDIGMLSWGHIKYGNFIASVLKFLVIAFVLFLLVKAINSARKKATPPPPGPTTTEQLLMEIRDLLKK